MKVTKTYKLIVTEKTMKLGNEVTMTGELYKVPVGRTWTMNEKQFKKAKYVTEVFGHGCNTAIPIAHLKVVEVTEKTYQTRKVIQK